MNKSRLIVIGSLCLTTCCCVRLYSIRQKTGGTEVCPTVAPRFGIPFYLKKARYKQTTTYEKVWYEVILERGIKVAVQDADKIKTVELSLGTVTASVSDRNDRALLNLIDKVKQAAFDPSVVTGDSLKTAVAAMPTELKPTFTPEPVANVLAAEPYVDYSAPYYFNTRLPWFGTGSGTLKTNADGTLSEGTAAAESKGIELLSSVVPGKEIITGLLSATPLNMIAAATKLDKIAPGMRLLDVAPSATPSATVILQPYAKLQIEKKGIVCDFVKYTNEFPSMSVDSQGRVTLGRVSLDSDTNNCRPIGAKAETGGGQAITFSGDVKLPKEEK